MKVIQRSRPDEHSPAHVHNYPHTTIMSHLSKYYYSYYVQASFPIDMQILLILNLCYFYGWKSF